MNQKKSWYADYVYQAENPFAGIAPEVIELLRAELAEGEEILWFEQPSAGSLWRARSIIPLLLMGVYGFIYGVLPVLTGNPNSINWIVLVFLLLSIPFNYFSLVWIAKKSLYVLTNSRAIDIDANAKRIRKAKSYYFQLQISQTSLKLNKRKNGTGDLYFAKTAEGGYQSKVGFLGIREAEQVKQLFEEILIAKAEDLVTALPAKMQPVVKADLTPGEKVLWAGQPEPYWIVKKTLGQWHYFGMAAFVGLLVISMVIIAASLFSFGNIPWLIAGIGLFLLSSIGLFFTAKKAFKEAQEANSKASKIAYLLTNRRIMQVSAFSPEEENVSSYYFSGQPFKDGLTVVKRNGGPADIYLSVPDARDSNFFRLKVELTGIWEPDKVEQLIRQQLASY